MAKKKIIITLSRLFPVTHSRKGQPTNYAELLNAGKKLHTIRANYDLWKVNEEKMRTGNYYLSVRQWSGRPYHSKQIEVAQIKTSITVQRIMLTNNPDAEQEPISAIIDGKALSYEGCKALARNDGLSIQDFREWFFGKELEHISTFEGCIIQFTDFKY